ncbi:50S ribosomal protein L25 [Candidatus Oscillochloris fontis]|uniref:50S ribosomal protein L25 n=1 Tax=Candidatus Oscillochloris fontis TaxID=2496868 RepID=UPI00101B6564|nr:50S ribosomal protein L25 [Candidatus Oscillochloris fontis]
MSTHQTLKAEVRTVFGKKVKYLRTSGLIPCTIYGKGFEAVSAQVSAREFDLVFRKAGRTTLIDLNIGSQGISVVFVQDIQRHPVTRAILHIDFKVVDLKKLVHIEVPVIAVGESPLVARGDALLNHPVSMVMVEALPNDLPQHIEIDVSCLDSMEKVIHVRDLAAQTGYKIINDGGDVLFSLGQLRAIQEEAVQAAPAEPELIRKPRAADEE